MGVYIYLFHQIFYIFDFILVVHLQKAAHGSLFVLGRQDGD